MATASNILLEPIGDENGVAIYQTASPAGAGFFLVVEAKPGSSGLSPGSSRFSSDSAERPDFQIMASRDLGFGTGLGSTAVCDNGPLPGFPLGGIPGFDPIDFGPSQEVTDALNDFGCRFDNNTSDPCVKECEECENGFVSNGTTQFCTGSVVPRGYAFPKGDTLLVVQWRDSGGNIGSQGRIIVRVP